MRGRRAAARRRRPAPDVNGRAVPASASPARSLGGGCIAHALHDGLTDMMYVLLPVWQAQFGLGYGALALLRRLYVGALAAFQLPAGHAAERPGFRDLESGATEAHFRRLRSGLVPTAETSALHLDLLRDLKRINDHLVAGAAYPVLQREGELLQSRIGTANGSDNS